MHRRKYVLAVSWDDRGVEDADEVVVFAESAAEAKSAARSKWRLTIGAQWPHCRVTDVSILTPKKLRPAWLPQDA